jgi:hypothetical protein
MPTLRGVLTPHSYGPESEGFFSRLATQPTTARKNLYDTMISALVAAGVWAKLDALYILAAADQATALTNLVQSSYGGSATNSPTFTADQGFAGGGTKYISTGFNPTTASAAKFTRNSASIFVWSLTSGTDAGDGFGYANGNVSATLTPRYSDGKNYVLVNDATTYSATVADGSGLLHGTRNSSSTKDIYKNGSAQASGFSAASIALINSTLTILKGIDGSYSGTIAAAGLGSGMTSQNAADLYSALHAYLQAVAGVP